MRDAWEPRRASLKRLTAGLAEELGRCRPRRRGFAAALPMLGVIVAARARAGPRFTDFAGTVRRPTARARPLDTGWSRRRRPLWRRKDSTVLFPRGPIRAGDSGSAGSRPTLRPSEPPPGEAATPQEQRLGGLTITHRCAIQVLTRLTRCRSWCPMPLTTAWLHGVRGRAGHGRALAHGEPRPHHRRHAAMRGVGVADAGGDACSASRDSVHGNGSVAVLPHSPQRDEIAHRMPRLVRGTPSRRESLPSLPPPRLPPTPGPIPPPPGISYYDGYTTDGRGQSFLVVPCDGVQPDDSRTSVRVRWFADTDAVTDEPSTNASRSSARDCGPSGAGANARQRRSVLFLCSTSCCSRSRPRGRTDDR